MQEVRYIGTCKINDLFVYLFISIHQIVRYLSRLRHSALILTNRNEKLSKNENLINITNSII